MTVYIFTGPTLSPEEGRGELDAIFVQPAAHGDVYRAALDRPRAIGIIDGYFERVPSVWHKEILWAMSQGIHVFGSASMGALRAAELAAFGMEGVGAIYESFASGELEDDDEVAVVHGPPEAGYRTLSEAMVNIRATLRAAADAGVIGPGAHAGLEAIAKELFYPERSYPTLLSRGAERGLPAPELDALRAWLPGGRVNQKRLDALAMLRLMRERLAAGIGPKRVGYTFEHTDAWEQVRRDAGRSDVRAPVLIEALVEELRVSGAWRGARLGALMRALALAEARRQGLAVNGEVLKATSEQFRRTRGLHDPADTEAWMTSQGLHLDGFTTLLRDEALVQRVEILFEQEIVRRLPDHLRVSGEYAALVSRALEKRKLLSSRGLEEPVQADSGLTSDELLRWYFVERLGCSMPDDIEDWARGAGFADSDDLRRAVLRERCFLRLREPGNPS
ncbi:TfuA-like protein [Sorangium sp. So ce406]|uniref:TfuA-like protein n=1 Tax=Sorangium sp. So ce406 TaxID=3133311 RepID=UPI003F5B88C9